MTFSKRWGRVKQLGQMAKRLSYLAAIGVAFGFISTVHAAGVAPCTGGSTTAETVLPVYNNVQTYCVSDFGWSDSWFGGKPSSYSAGLDVLSGDDAVTLRYTGQPGTYLNWLGPSVDSGTMSPVNKSGNIWSIVTPVAYVGGNTSIARSVIQNAANTLRITITTTVTNYLVSLNFNIQNIGASTISNIQIGDYFNFHPNGSTGSATTDTAARNQGVVQYLNGNSGLCPTTTSCVLTSGNASRTDYIADGFMWGDRAPDRYILGSANTSVPGSNNDVSADNRIWRRAETNNFTTSGQQVTTGIWPTNSSTGRGDAAAYFQWDLGNLTAGQSTQFNIYKLLATPEPAAWHLVLLGGVIFGVFRRRKAA